MMKKSIFALSLSLLISSQTKTLWAGEPITVIKCTSSVGANFEMWPQIYVKKNKLCFDAVNWPDFKGSNCLDKNGSATWSAVVLLLKDGESIGRDQTKFRIMNATFTDELIEYAVEWSRNNEWQVKQRLTINRLTGGGVDWFVGEHGGASIKCNAQGRKF